MKTITRFAVAALAAAVASPAMAVFDPADFDANTIVVNTTGASAQRSAINQFSKLVCAGGVFREYRDKNPVSGTVGGAWRSYFCEFAATWPNGDPNPLAGQKVLFNTRTRGGSVWGVLPIQENYSVEMMNILGPNCALNGSRYECTVNAGDRSAGVVGSECDIAAAVEGGGTGRPIANGKSTLCVKGDLGASDEEPSFFTDENLPSVFPIGPDESKLTKAALFGVQFAPEVTLPVYRVLQEAQGILNPGDPDDYDNPATAPSLTKEQLAAIFSGEITNWNQVATPVVGGAEWPDFNTGSLGVCRRVNGSGTQAGAARYMFSRPGKCGGSVFMVTDNTAADGSANGTCDDAANGQLCYVENSGSDDVNTCMDRMNGVGPSINTFLNGFGVNMGAIGFNAIEKPSVPGVSQWRFVKVDGVEPTTANGVSGEWDWAFENSMQHSVNFPYPQTSAGTAIVVPEMLNQLGDPQVVNLLGTAGNWALRDNGFTPSASAPLVGFGSRLGNSCNEVIIVP